MKSFFIIFSVCILFSQVVKAQGEDLGEPIPSQQKEGYKLKLQRYRYKNPIIENGDTVWCYTWNPGVWIYAPLKFKSEKQRRDFNKLVYNVKKVLPIAQRVNSIIGETVEILEMLPDKKSKEKHLANVKRDLRRQYEPEMRKLTYSQGKLLIKLIDRECNQSSYEIVKTFFGTGEAVVSQIFAWTFRASLKKKYQPEDDDKLIERVVLLVENGQL